MLFRSVNVLFRRVNVLFRRVNVLFFFFWRAWNDSFPCVLQQVTSLDN